MGHNESHDPLSQAMEKVPGIGKEPESREQLLAAIEGAEMDEKLHLEAAAIAHEKAAEYADRLKAKLPIHQENKNEEKA